MSTKLEKDIDQIVAAVEVSYELISVFCAREECHTVSDLFAERWKKYSILLEEVKNKAYETSELILFISKSLEMFECILQYLPSKYIKKNQIKEQELLSLREFEFLLREEYAQLKKIDINLNKENVGVVSSLYSKRLFSFYNQIAPLEASLN